MATPLRILIVDDDPEIRATLGEVLTTEGHRVSEAVNGLDGLARARTDRPDVVLLDLMMPVMDGWTFRMHQQMDPRLAQVPTLVISASPRAELHRLGDVEHLHKPFSLDALLAAIDRIVAGPRGGTSAPVT